MIEENSESFVSRDILKKNVKKKLQEDDEEIFLEGSAIFLTWTFLSNFIKNFTKPCGDVVNLKKKSLKFDNLSKIV